MVTVFRMAPSNHLIRDMDRGILIELVKERRPLWDTTLPQRVNLKPKLWIEVSEQMTQRTGNGYSDDICKKQFKNLTDLFRNHLRECYQQAKFFKCPPETILISWQYWEQMQFLKSHMKQRVSVARKDDLKDVKRRKVCDELQAEHVVHFSDAFRKSEKEKKVYKPVFSSDKTVNTPSVPIAPITTNEQLFTTNIDDNKDYSIKMTDVKEEKEEEGEMNVELLIGKRGDKNLIEVKKEVEDATYSTSDNPSTSVIPIAQTNTSIIRRIAGVNAPNKRGSLEKKITEEKNSELQKRIQQDHLLSDCLEQQMRRTQRRTASADDLLCSVQKNLNLLISADHFSVDSFLKQLLTMNARMMNLNKIHMKSIRHDHDYIQRKWGLNT